MKNNLTIQTMGIALYHITKTPKEISGSQNVVLSEYRKIMTNAKDIGRKNPLLSAYALGAWFIAMNRTNHLTPEENCTILIEGLRSSQIFRLVMGNADHYLSPKRISRQKKWAESTHQRVYENNWVVNLLLPTKQYDLGYDYLECGICKLCHDEGCPELAKYLCKLDFFFAEVMELQLKRTTTLAEGGSKCDFRFFRK